MRSWPGSSARRAPGRAGEGSRSSRTRTVQPGPPRALRAEGRRRHAGGGRLPGGKEDYLKALDALEAVATWLEGLGHPSAAGSVRERMPETLTINRLGVPPKLQVSLYF